MTEQRDSMNQTVTPVVSAGDVPVGEASRPREGRAKPRTLTAEFKRRIVAECDAAPKVHDGAISRRERLYDSHLKEWRAAIATGTLEAPRRPKGSGRSPEQVRNKHVLYDPYGACRYG